MSTTRPSQNTSGQAKKPSANPDGGPRPQLTPTAAGAVNPMTHPQHPDVQAAAANAGGVKQSQLLAEQGGNPSGNPLGNISPTPTSDVRQVRENVNFHDLSPIEQSQTAEQQGMNPYLPLQMLQQQAQGAAQQGPSGGPVPNTLMGPFTPPGVESFPDDMAHLTTLMQQGYAPGSSPQEHALAQNAHAIARARDAAAQAQADQTSQQHLQMPSPQLAPSAGPTPSPAGVAASVGPASYAIPPGAPQAPAGMSPMPGGMPMPQQPAAPPLAPGGAPMPAAGAPPQAPMPQPGAAPITGPAGAPPPGLIQALMQRHKRPV